MYNCLCAALGDGENQARFLRAEGVELMILALKERRYASRCALRVLDAALRANGANCERLVDIRGFKTLFPLLGAPPPPPPTVKGKAEKAAFARQYDESLTSLLATLFHELGAERRQRLLGKFAEEGMAKLTKLLELHAAYAERVADAEAAALSFRDDATTTTTTRRRTSARTSQRSRRARTRCSARRCASATSPPPRTKSCASA